VIWETLQPETRHSIGNHHGEVLPGGKSGALVRYVCGCERWPATGRTNICDYHEGYDVAFFEMASRKHDLP
jgi:hypothetical protein